jgi:hypothetical protein
MVPGLTMGPKVSSYSTPGRWVKPRMTQGALYQSMEPSTFILCLKIHFLVTTLAQERHGTRSHVWFASKTYGQRMTRARSLEKITLRGPGGRKAIEHQWPDG